MTKRYDRAYFDRWYRGRGRIDTPAGLRRRVALAVAVAEHSLERPLRSALDVGCGEGRWRAQLRRLRPRLRYRGVDPSPYVVERFGRRRGIELGGFGDLPALALGVHDLVVCADVLHYVRDEALTAGLPSLAAAVGGVAYLEVMTAADEVEGDRRGMILRQPEEYHERLAALGLTYVGSCCWLSPRLARSASVLDTHPVPRFRVRAPRARPDATKPGRAGGV